MEYTQFLQKSLSEVAEIARSEFGHVASTVKEGDPNQVLTQTDQEIGRVLIEKISSSFPNDSIIDEEAGIIKRDANRIWVVDPIDGTSNFANGVPTYGVMLGLLENNIPVAGGIALPQFDAIYVAEKGKGAFRNGERIQSTSESDLLKILMGYGIDGNHNDPEKTHEEAIIWANLALAVRNMRSSNSVFDLCMVAEGRYGAFLNRTSKIWDNVAPQVVLTESGCLYTDYWGAEIDYSNPFENVQNNFTVCTAPPELHKKIQEIVHT